MRFPSLDSMGLQFARRCYWSIAKGLCGWERVVVFTESTMVLPIIMG